jgi:hypothetical protein
VGRGFAASAIVIAVVVARCFVGPGAAHPIERRATLAGSSGLHHITVRSTRTEADTPRASSSYGIGELIAPPVIVLAMGPTPEPAPRFRDPDVAVPVPRPGPARARAPPPATS